MREGRGWKHADRKRAFRQKLTFELAAYQVESSALVRESTTAGLYSAYISLGEAEKLKDILPLLMSEEEKHAKKGGHPDPHLSGRELRVLRFPGYKKGEIWSVVKPSEIKAVKERLLVREEKSRSLRRHKLVTSIQGLARTLVNQSPRCYGSPPKYACEKDARDLVWARIRVSTKVNGERKWKWKWQWVKPRIDSSIELSLCPGKRQKFGDPPCHDGELCGGVRVDEEAKAQNEALGNCRTPMSRRELCLVREFCLHPYDEGPFFYDRMSRYWRLYAQMGVPKSGPEERRSLVDVTWGRREKKEANRRNRRERQEREVKEIGFVRTNDNWGAWPENVETWEQMMRGVEKPIEGKVELEGLDDGVELDVEIEENEAGGAKRAGE